MIKKEYKNEYGDDLVFEFPDELLPKYERWVELNTDFSPDHWYEWDLLDNDLLPYKTDLNP
jgi:hypothetical protein